MTRRFALLPDDLICALDGQTVRVLGLLATYADFKTGRNAFPAIATLATRLNVAENTVRRALKLGVKSGALKAHKHHGKGVQQQTTSYDCLWIPTATVKQNTLGVQPTEALGVQPTEAYHPQTTLHPEFGPMLTAADFRDARAWRAAQNDAKRLVAAWNELAPIAKHPPLKDAIPVAYRDIWATHTPEQVALFLRPAALRGESLINALRRKG